MDGNQCEYTVIVQGLAGDGGVMDGLRSELSAIVERSRMGDRKQQELEQIITKLEDEVSRFSSQNIQLEERLADKMAQIASMESKLGQRNLRVVDLQKELEEKITDINNLQRDVGAALPLNSENSGIPKVTPSLMVPIRKGFPSN